MLTFDLCISMVSPQSALVQTDTVSGIHSLDVRSFNLLRGSTVALPLPLAEGNSSLGVSERASIGDSVACFAFRAIR